MRVLFLLHSLGIDERLGIMMLSSILKREGHEVELLLTRHLPVEACLKEIKRFGADVLAYSIMTGEHGYHISLNEKIKRAHPCFSVFGGPHPTFKPEMVASPGVDAVCRGEGDIYFPILLEKMAAGKNFYDTPNFWFKKPDGSVVKNDIGPLAEDLDALPFADRDIVYDAAPVLKARGKTMFMAMRGCPYHCSFCFNHAYNRLTRGKGEMLRYRSVDNLIAEIKEVKQRHFMDRVFIDDDTFLIKPEGWLEDFARRFASEIGLPLTCNVRSDLVNDKIIDLLKQMNCTTVIMGLDPPDEEIAGRVLRRFIPVKEVMDTCRLLNSRGIRIITQNMLGLPVDRPLDTALESLDYNIRLKPYLALSNLLFPYPGTEIERIAIRKRMFVPGYEKRRASNQMNSALIFRDPGEKQKIIALAKLFGVIVEFPFLRPWVPLLISLPMRYIYTQLFYIFFGYKMFRLARKRLLTQAVRGYIPFYLRHIRRWGRKKQDTQPFV